MKAASSSQQGGVEISLLGQNEGSIQLIQAQHDSSPCVLVSELDRMLSAWAPLAVLGLWWTVHDAVPSSTGLAVHHDAFEEQRVAHDGAEGGLVLPREDGRIEAAHLASAFVRCACFLRVVGKGAAKRSHKVLFSRGL